MAAALAARNAAKQDVAELKLMVAEERPIYQNFIESGLRQGLSKYHELNETLHLRIAKLSGNEVLYDQMDFSPSPMASPMASPMEHCK